MMLTKKCYFLSVFIPIAFSSIFLPTKMRPTPVQDRHPGTSADVPDVPSLTSMSGPGE